MKQQGSIISPEFGSAAAEADELRSLFTLTDRLFRAQSLFDVYEAALDAIISTLGCGRASILEFDEGGQMRFVAWRGLSEAYRRGLAGHSPWKPNERNAQPIFVSDIELSDEADWVKAAIRQEGIRALGFVPLVYRGGVVGKFMTYFEAPHVFTEHEIELAVMIARQVGFSIERSRAERARRAAEAELRASEERFRLMLEHAPVMIWLSDATGACVHINRMLRAVWGVPDDALAGFDWRDTLHPEDAPEITRIVGDGLVRRCGVVVRGRFRNARGQYRLFETDARPRFAPDGSFLGLIGVNTDITEREEAEAALRASEERFRLAVEAAPCAMLMADDAGRIVLANANAEALFGLPRHDLVGELLERLVPGCSLEKLDFSRPMGPGAPWECAAVRKDGAEVPIEIGLSPIEVDGRSFTIAAIVDITFRKHHEAQRDLLLAELSHRVKNTLAVVQSIAHQTFKGTARAARAAFEGRLVALATAHSLLTEMNWHDASLEQLAADSLAVAGPSRERISLIGPRVMLMPKEALAIALALHELCTNALKYGALSTDAGQVSLEWERVDGPEPRLKLVWKEAGGPPVAVPTHRGFGSFLLQRALAHDLGGAVAVEFRPDGLRCAIDAPLRKA
jgi:PAS domain S-box-containing protein